MRLTYFTSTRDQFLTSMFSLLDFVVGACSSTSVGSELVSPIGSFPLSFLDRVVVGSETFES